MYEKSCLRNVDGWQNGCFFLRLSSRGLRRTGLNTAKCYVRCVSPDLCLALRRLRCGGVEVVLFASLSLERWVLASSSWYQGMCGACCLPQGCESRVLLPFDAVPLARRNQRSSQLLSVPGLGARGRGTEQIEEARAALRPCRSHGFVEVQRNTRLNEAGLVGDGNFAGDRLREEC